MGTVKKAIKAAKQYDLHKKEALTNAAKASAKQAASEISKSPAKAKDGKWIQKAVNPAHKGYCTPMTKATCTPSLCWQTCS